MRPDLREKNVYIEGDNQETFAMDPMLVDGTFSMRGQYIRAIINRSSLSSKLRLVSYHMANWHIAFLFQYDNKSFFFLIKSTKDILKMN
jgi:hypothetical protein